MVAAAALVAIVEGTTSTSAAQPQDPSFAAAIAPSGVAIPYLPYLIATGDATGPMSAGVDGKPEVAILGQGCLNGFDDCDTVIEVSRNTGGPASLSFQSMQTIMVDLDLAAIGFGNTITLDSTTTVAQLEFIDVTNDGFADLVLTAPLVQGPGSAIVVYRYREATDNFALVSTVATSSIPQMQLSNALSSIVFDDWGSIDSSGNSSGVLDGVPDIVAATGEDSGNSGPVNTLWRLTNTEVNGSYGHFVVNPGVVQTLSSPSTLTQLAVATDFRRFSAMSQQGTAASGLDVITLGDAGSTSLTRADAIGGFQFLFSDFGASGFPNSGAEMFAAELKAGTEDKSILLWNGGTQVDALHTRHRTGAVVGLPETYNVFPMCPPAGGEDDILDAAAIGHLNDDDQHDIAIVSNKCDEVHLLIGDGANRTMTNTDSFGMPIVLPLLVQYGGSFNDVVIDDMDGDGSDDILLVRLGEIEDEDVVVVEYFKNMN